MTSDYNRNAEQADNEKFCQGARAQKKVSDAKIKQLIELLQRWLEADDWRLRGGFEVQIAYDTRLMLKSLKSLKSDG